MLVDLFNMLVANSLWIGIGAVAASIIWFFVWRNNKKYLVQKAEEADEYLAQLTKMRSRKQAAKKK